ncbi:hypothetical protein QJS10_CPB17g01598 [Acorus calamus]|uniref:Uncharacterized protein n=1 Tax=Acorus calamus TaxID=4465 RepID=A0AAV9CVX7_ACOCL|nr:hypothetical protein QJS10_CPB17g01598 [Acorus calamus]
MIGIHLKLFVSVLVMAQVLLKSVVPGSSWCHHHRPPNTKFEQRTNQFWEFEEKSNRWVEISLPFDLLSCMNGTCTKVGSIEKVEENDKYSGRNSVQEKGEKFELGHKKQVEVVGIGDQILPLRKRVSLTKMSEGSIWATGQSGSIYERFWNGVQWVIAPRDLPEPVHAVSVFIVNHTILALCEEGILYQLQISENSQPGWAEFTQAVEGSVRDSEVEPSMTMGIKSGVVSSDGEKMYFSTLNGSLLELSELQPIRWKNHGWPPGGNVAAIADVGNIKPGVVFTVSSSGDLYEFNKNSKPLWKKHIWSDASMEGVSLTATTGCALHGLMGAQSISLFLLSKGGFLMERRLHQRKWKWIVHGAPKGQYLSSITPVTQNELAENIFSLFFTTTIGLVFEYRLSKHSGANQRNQLEETWVNHLHPPEAKIARSIPGVQLHAGRIFFPLDDGRLAELHLSSIGGEWSGPAQHINTRRKSSYKYKWSILDAPETEGWNAEYCTEERGPLNCLSGVTDAIKEPSELGSTISARRRKGHDHHHYLIPKNDESIEQNNLLKGSAINNYRMRAMYADRSFFIISEDGFTFEFMYTENVWLWLRHEHTSTMKSIVGNYNGSLFLVDVLGNLLMRERSMNELSWINCTAMRRGRQVVTGPPWDAIPGKAQRITAEDAMFFVDKKGKLLQFTVALRKFKWKDCQHPPNAKLAFIVDQEVFRTNIIFTIGRNGHLYQYNKITELWHQHHQSPHLVLSRSPGTTCRTSPTSLTGSLFMVSETGRLIEYHWNPSDGWNWVEHGTPHKDMTLVGAPGPCIGGDHLFLIGSDGEVYTRYLDQRAWKWQSYGFPRIDARNTRDHDKNCDEKVGLVRPIPFSEDSVIFELRDGRLAELRRVDGDDWAWLRIIGTPMSPCVSDYWTALAT